MYSSWVKNSDWLKCILKFDQSIPNLRKLSEGKTTVGVKLGYVEKGKYVFHARISHVCEKSTALTYLKNV